MGNSKLKVKGSPFKYPWDKWLSEGATHVLKRGKHFAPSPRIFVIYLYQRVKKAGAKVKVEYLGDDGIRLTVIKVKKGRKSA